MFALKVCCRLAECPRHCPVSVVVLSKEKNNSKKLQHLDDVAVDIAIADDVNDAAVAAHADDDEVANKAQRYINQAAN